MIERDSQIKELYDFRHFNDNNAGKEPFDYENKLLPNMMSRVMFKNDTTRAFLELLQKKNVWLLEATLVARNFFNYAVGKYYNKWTN
jgi:hypothetical protein